MFTGIVREVGTVRSLRPRTHARELTIALDALAGEVSVGDSVNVDGACLTAASVNDQLVTFDVGAETLKLTTLGELREGDPVNLEPALRVGDRLGGHFVSGHVDATGTVTGKRQAPGEVRLEVATEQRLTDLMILKGSVAVDGISLTIAALEPGRFEASLIPHTLEVTTMGRTAAGDQVNLECDMLGRWVRRLLGREAAGSLTLQDLEEQGF